MKKSFHMISLLALLLTFAVSTAWAAQRTLTADGNGGYYINMPKTGVDTLVIPDGVTTFKVYDDGGPNETFSAGCEGFLLLTAPEGRLLRLAGSIKTNYYSVSVGYLTVYDGVDANAGYLLYDYGNVPNLRKKLSTQENMFLQFRGSGDHWKTEYEGLDLTITVVNPNGPHAINIKTAENGSFVNPPATAMPGEVVTLMASPDAGYILSRARVQDEYVEDEYESNVEHTGGWYTDNTIIFTMPQTEVTITPSFDYVQSAGVVIKKSGAETVSIPTDIKSFGLEVGYSDDAIDSYILLTAPEGRILQIQGEVVSRTGLDSLYVYDGVDVNATELLKTAALASVNQVSSGRNLTLHYKELGQNRGMGSSLRVNVIDPDAELAVSIDGYIYDGSVETDKTVAKFNSPVTVSATPAENYFLNRIEVRGADSWNPIAITGGTWYSSNEATFAMPSEDVVVSASFVGGLSANNGLGMSVPLYDVLRVSIPAGVESFVLDDYGLGENELSKPLIIIAPEGYLLQIEDANYDFGYGFNVYEGDIADPVAANAEQKSGTVVGRALTVVCVGSGEMMYQMMVRLIPNEEHEITVAELAENGGVSISPVSGRAYAGDTITLTAAPDDGYELYEMEAWWYDEYNNQHYVEISGGTWYNNEAKFVMPLADVYYTAYFAPHVYMDYDVNIPKTGDISVNIPEGVTRLTVYDDNSGYYGSYSNNDDGTLTLTAPEGYSLLVAGSVATTEEADSLVIYDGADVNASKLLKKYGEEYFENIYSSGRSLTFRFKSNAEWNSYGLELNVIVLKKSGFGAVAIYEADGFKMARVDGNYTGNETVNISEPIDVNGIEYNRDFTSGNPATVVLPFALPEGTEINADFYALTAVVQNGNRWKATLTYIGEGELPKANTPYAIIPADDYLGFDFDGTATLQTSTKDTTKVSDGDWLFVGTYSNKTWAAGDSELGLAYAIAATDNEGGAKKGQFGKISAGASATPFQAYLRKKDSSVQLARQQNSPAAPGTRYSVDFVPEETIDVEFVKASTDGSGDVMTVAKGRWNMRTGEFQMQRTYDIKGRKLNGTPKTHGAYYGKKVLKK